MLVLHDDATREYAYGPAQGLPDSKVGTFTQALYDARELAMERMQTEAQELQAEGIVGVQLQERSHGWGSRSGRSWWPMSWPRRPQSWTWSVPQAWTSA